MRSVRASHPKRSLRSGFLALAIGCNESATAQQSAPHVAEATRTAIDRLEANPQVRGMFASCPADTFRRARAASRIRVAMPGSAQCAADPVGCYEACMGGSGSSCFNLARAFQAAGQIVPPRYSEMLFAVACGFGDAGGCTNRASGIRNTSFEGNPFEGVAEVAQEACQFRTFTLTCRQNDAWGCAMLGQAYRLGEGVASIATASRAAFQKSCQLSPDFAACAFSKRNVREMADERPGR